MKVHRISTGLTRYELEMTISRHLRFLKLKVNVYAIESNSGVLLFDCGPEEAFESLRSALRDCPVQQVCLTHGHADHVGAGVHWLGEGARIYAAEGDWAMTQSGGPRGAPRSFTYSGFKPTGFVQPGDAITLGDYKFEVISTPGHSAGSVCYYAREKDMLICGDLLFGPFISLTTSIPELVSAWRQQPQELEEHLESLDRVQSPSAR